MVKVGLLLRLEAKPGKEAEVAEFLTSAIPLIQQEEATIAWFAIQLGPSTFGIFDVFPDDDGRNAHMTGKVADALRARWSEMLTVAPTVEKIDVLAAKLP